MNENITKAAEMLYNTGMLARSEDEAELLRWFRMLSPTAQKMESARAAGMALALPYAREEVTQHESVCRNT